MLSVEAPRHKNGMWQVDQPQKNEGIATEGNWFQGHLHPHQYGILDSSIQGPHFLEIQINQRENRMLMYCFPEMKTKEKGMLSTREL